MDDAVTFHILFYFLEINFVLEECGEMDNKLTWVHSWCDIPAIRLTSFSYNTITIVISRNGGNRHNSLS